MNFLFPDVYLFVKDIKSQLIWYTMWGFIMPYKLIMLHASRLSLVGRVASAPFFDLRVLSLEFIWEKIWKKSWCNFFFDSLGQFFLFSLFWSTTHTKEAKNENFYLLRYLIATCFIGFLSSRRFFWYPSLLKSVD